jgi:hypothetical protein
MAPLRRFVLKLSFLRKRRVCAKATACLLPSRHKIRLFPLLGCFGRRRCCRCGSDQPARCSRRGVPGD